MLRTVFQLSLVSRPVSRLIKSQIRSMAKFSSVHDFTVKNLQGEPVSLSKYKGKVILIENVASLWGTTVRDYTQVCNMSLRKWVFHLPRRLFSADAGTSFDCCTFVGLPVLAPNKSAVVSIWTRIAFYRGQHVFQISNIKFHSSQLRLVKFEVANNSKAFVN